MIGPSATFHLYQRGKVWWIRITPFDPWKRVEERPCTPAECARFKLKGES